MDWAQVADATRQHRLVAYLALVPRERFHQHVRIDSFDLRVPEMGWTLLHFACAYGDVAAVRHLLAAGLNVNALDRFNCTPLFVLCASQRINAATAMTIARLLAAAGTDANVLCDRRHCALTFALLRGHDELATLLISGMGARTELVHGVAERACIAPWMTALERGRRHCRAAALVALGRLRVRTLALAIWCTRSEWHTV